MYKKNKSKKQNRSKKITRKSRVTYGGYKPYTPLTNLASSAGAFFGATAKPHNYVGGKRKINKNK